MKKLFLLMFVMILLVVPISAEVFTIDNRLTYSNEDLKVNFDNLWGFGKYYGSIELKSHPSVDYIKKVGTGNKVVMWYDFDFNDSYINGLGEVEFTDERTGEIIDRDYSYVYWGGKVRDVYGQGDCFLNINGTQTCKTIVIGTEIYEDWLPYNSKDIPKGNIRIGIKVETIDGDYVDGVWEIVGKKVKKHAIWNASLEVDLIGWWKLDEGTGNAIDSFSTNDLTESGTVPNQTGKIGSARGVYGTANFFSNTNVLSVDSATSHSVSLWVNILSLANEGILNIGGDNDANIFETRVVETGGDIQVRTVESGVAVRLTLNSSINTGWSHIVFTYDGSTREGILYINGSSVDSGTGTAGGNAGTKFFIGHSEDSGAEFENGYVDETALYSKVLTPSEVTTLFNDFNGCTLFVCDLDIPTVTLNSPIDFFNSTSQTIDFNGTVSSSSTLLDVSLIIDGIFNETNSSGIEGDYLFTKIIEDGTHNWTYEACNSDGCVNATTRTFTIDTANPKVNVTFPNETIPFQEINTNLFVNWTVSDINLDVCIINYNGVNTTVTCLDNNTNINITTIDNRSLTLFVNDTFGKTNSSSVSWNYIIFENIQTFNTSSFETAKETFTINITTDGTTPTSAKLIYDGTTFSSATITNTAGNDFDISRTIDIPLVNETKTWFFNFTINGTEISSSTQTQLINATNFTLCNAELTVPFLNITFKDEGNLSDLSASITTSEFVYYLGSGTINKTLEFINNTNNLNYTFCSSTTNRTLNVDPVVQYKSGSSYPQRIWDEVVQQYTNTTTQQVLFLLSSIDGIFVTFQVINQAEQPLEGVVVTGTRIIDGSEILVASGTTSAAGSVTFWLNPDFSHTFTFVKEGFTTFVTSLFPNLPTFTIQLGVTTEVVQDFTQGISYTIRPAGDYLEQNTNHTFNFTLSSTFFTVDQFGITLRFANGTEVGTNTSTSNGGTLSLFTNVSNDSKIFLDFNYLINETFSNGTRTWIIQDLAGSEFSILRFFTDLSLYIDAGLFGLDDFGKAFLSFIILLTTVGILSTRYGIASEAALMGIIFGIVLFLDVGIGLIPNPDFGGINRIDNFISVLTGIILISILIREETR